MNKMSGKRSKAHSKRITKNKIIKDQKYFFNQNSKQDKTYQQRKIFADYVNKEQYAGFKWISDKRNILEYGCGTGTSLDIFFSLFKRGKYAIYGVDIANLAVKRAKEKYPEFNFYTIKNNKMPMIKDNSMDAVFSFHVLHHTKNHEDIFREIHNKLKKGGKFLINDLSSNNIFNATARSVFVHTPKFVKSKFNDDLLVGDSIPEKYKVNLDLVCKELSKAGFKIVGIEYGHLFFFLFGWVDRFIPLSYLPPINTLYKHLINLENNLLRYSLFQRQAEVISIKCIKK